MNTRKLTTQTWELKIEDPSGETRIVPVLVQETKNQIDALNEFEISRSPQSAIPIRDLTLPHQIGFVSHDKKKGRFTIQFNPTVTSAKIGAFHVQHCELPQNVPISFGETRLTLLKKNEQVLLPMFPRNTKPWLTQSESGRRLLWTCKKAANTPLSVYIAGETGTGKEVIANLLHAWSTRARGPFIALNCGALQVSLAESELFGHIKGAFTGAIAPRSGALLQAHHGTLFLDEIGDLPLDIQVKLLRFLENGEIRPVGSDSVSKSDVRILCATHQPLRQLVEEGKFRRDLFYRLASISLEIPPLRNRPDDIDLLSHQFASDLGKSLSTAATLKLKSYGWPGNVRELRHAIERAVGFGGEFQTILSEDDFESLGANEGYQVAAAPESEFYSPVLRLDEVEKTMLLKALRLSQGNRALAARILGVARSTLFVMIKRHKIQGPKKFDFDLKV